VQSSSYALWRLCRGEADDRGAWVQNWISRSGVQYIYADAADILGKKASDESFVRTMLSLIGTAAYFGLPVLYKTAKDVAPSRTSLSYGLPLVDLSAPWRTLP
jgi:hypothetical protein